MAWTKTLMVAEVAFVLLSLFFVIAHRFQFLPFKLAFGGFTLMLLLSAVGALVALVGIILALTARLDITIIHAVYALLIGGLPLIAVTLTVGKGLSVPKIHDISTDTTNIIAFSHAQHLRKSEENSVVLPNEKVLSAQKAHYRDLKPLVVDGSPAEAYSRSLELAKQLGWQIHYKDDEKLHFEAFDKTALFGFVDDIAVRVTTAGDTGAQIDLRSVSRVGLSDLGANAARIEAFQQAYVE